MMLCHQVVMNRKWVTGNHCPFCSQQSCVQLHLTLCNPLDCSPSGSSVHGIFKQEYWSGLPFPTPGDLPDPGIEPTSPASSALAGGFFTTVPAGKPIFKTVNTKIKLWSDFLNNNNITWSTNRGVILITMDCTQMWVYSKIFFAHLPWKWTLGSYVTSP